ncbi:MAG: UDP-N-acetylmuramate--L-alanine ligase [Bacteroidetes bacterium]|nr:UDP-N-acetylmuramate--L-alanine ligase [Bacteroidota bacterium]
MRILISGGGTGGHIYPAIAIAEKIKEKNQNNEILFVGSKGKMEISLVREAGFPMAEIWIDGFARWSLFKNILLPFKIIYSLWKSKKILKYFNPDIVIGTGGYVSATILSQASKLGIPIVIQEQNAVLGLTNKSFLKRATKFFVNDENLFNQINKKYKNKALLTGNPIRKDIAKSRISRRRALESYKLDPNKKTILVLGGSLGAKTINDTILKNLKKFINQDIQIIWQTGVYYYKKIMKKIPKEYLESIKPLYFIKDMKTAYAAADLVIARAGAVTISELSIKKKPTIFIPSPNVTNDHQTKNILSLHKKNAAIIIRDKEASSKLTNVALQIIKDTNKLKTLSKNIGENAFPKAADQIVEQILKIPHDISNLTNQQLTKRFKYAYFIGIGGIGMSSLAKWFSKNEVKVFGYDKSPSPITDDLKNFGITTGFEDGVRFMPRTILDNIRQTIVIYTPAIPLDNAILSYVKEKEYSIFKRSEILGKINEEKFTIAVAGTHGKTSTSALIAHILYYAKQNMIGFVGGILKKYNSNLISYNETKKNSIAVIEADEFDKSFLKLKPNLSIITSVDPDHLDIYKDKKGIETGYKKFIDLLPEQGRLIIQEDAFKTLYKKSVPSKIESISIKYSLNDSEVKADNILFYRGYTKFDYVRPDLKIKNIKLPLQGYHNVENALSAITVCGLLGISYEIIIKAIESFPGIQRRFDFIIDRPDLVFINDYAHHPTEISILIKSLKEMYSAKKITVVFQPHLYSRTKDFAKEFGQSLSQADKIFLLPIYPARELPIKNITSKTIFTKIKSKNKFLIEKEDLINKFKKEKPEVLVTIGAGDINDFVEPIKQKLLQR